MRRRAWPALPSLLLMAAGSLAPVPARAGGDEENEPRIFALVVGISDFKNLTDEQDLRYAEADAQLFADTLEAGLGDAVESKDIHLLLGRDATRGAVLNELVEVLGDADHNDVVIIFFSTHGMLDNGQGYLVAWDTEVTERLPFTAVPMRNVELEISQTRAQHVLMFTDACHAASVGYSGSKSSPSNEINDAIGSMRTASGSFFNMASSLVRQESLEGPEYCGGHGAFTCALTDAMKGAADVDQDGKVNLAELSVEVPGMVFETTRKKQLPEVKGSYDQSLVLSQVLSPPPARRTINWPRTAGVSMTALGGASLVGALVLGGVTLAEQRAFLDDELSDLSEIEDSADFAGREAQLTRRAGLSYGLLGLGAAMGTGGVLLWTGTF